MNSGKSHYEKWQISLWKVVNIKIKALEMKIDIQKWYILTLNSSLEMLVFNLWSPKMLRSVPLAGSKE